MEHGRDARAGRRGLSGGVHAGRALVPRPVGGRGVRVAAHDDAPRARAHAPAHVDAGDSRAARARIEHGLERADAARAERRGRSDRTRAPRRARAAHRRAAGRPGRAPAPDRRATQPRLPAAGDRRHLGITPRSVKRALERIMALSRAELVRLAGRGCGSGEPLVAGSPSVSPVSARFATRSCIWRRVRAAARCMSGSISGARRSPRSCLCQRSRTRSRGRSNASRTRSPTISRYPRRRAGATGARDHAGELGGHSSSTRR